MSNFGDVTYADSGASAPASGATQQQAALIDPNDPRLTSEALTVDASADAYAVLPVIPDGKWRAKAKQTDIKDARGQLQRYATFDYLQDRKPFFATNVEFSIIDHSGKFDGVPLTLYHVRTNVEERRGTSQAATLTLKLGGTLPPNGSSHKAYMDALQAALAPEPEVIIETAWEASCQACQDAAEKAGQRKPRAFLQGMHRFPATREPGVHEASVQCPACKGGVRAQARIVGFWNVKEMAATRGTGQGGGK